MAAVTPFRPGTVAASSLDVVRIPGAAGGDTVPARGRRGSDPVVARPYRASDRSALVRVWAATLAVGAPVALPAPIHDDYARLCLDWYLDVGNRCARRSVVAVVEQADQVVGYWLACLDEDHHRRWVRLASLRWAVATLRHVRHLDRVTATFIRLRLRDGVDLARRGSAAPFPAHAHVNLLAQVRGDMVAARLLHWMDDLVADRGLGGWYGEMNVPAGRPMRAVSALGGRVVDRVPNRTLSWMVGRAMERCTIARPLATRNGRVAARVAAAEAAGTAATSPAVTTRLADVVALRPTTNRPQ